MRLTFHGACREVTGSNILLEAVGKKILLDCGFFQGVKMAEERNYAPFPYDPKSIDFVIICHAHLDHTGRLPKLVRDGFVGRIYSTAPTKELTKLVLEDSEKLMREESNRQNHPPLYTQKEIEESMQLFEAIDYDKNLEITDGLKLTFKNAGHILGSATATIEAENQRLVYTSDLGNSPSELLPAPEDINEADYVICETTYGSRIHEDVGKREQKLGEIINKTIAQNGVLMIPTFAIERTQELLHDIEHFCKTANCSIPTFYLDSPLAIAVTKVFVKYQDQLNKNLQDEHKDGDIFGLPRLVITQTVEESKQINDAQNPKIIIAGAGMLNGGRILYHLQRYIEDPKNTLLFVGYQAKGTLGRRILDRDRQISIFGQKYNVGANVYAIGSYSAHADSVQLLSWISKIKGIKKIFLTHGEANEALAFAKTVESHLRVEAIIPQQGESYELLGDVPLASVLRPSGSSAGHNPDI